MTLHVVHGYIGQLHLATDHSRPCAPGNCLTVSLPLSPPGHSAVQLNVSSLTLNTDVVIVKSRSKQDAPPNVSATQCVVSVCVLDSVVVLDSVLSELFFGFSQQFFFVPKEKVFLIFFYLLGFFLGNVGYSPKSL